jgi:hypothetical protein
MCIILVGKPEGKRPLGRLERIYKNINVDLKDTIPQFIGLRTEIGDGLL